MLQKLFAAAIAVLISTQASAQLATTDTLAPKPSLTISGWADAYYRYDFAKNLANNKTSFTNSHNSFELGMASLRLDHSFGKVGFTGDFGFGRRAEEFAYTDTETRFIIKQLYLNYTLKNGLKFTAGSWATHVGYEVVDAYVNRNYSMSYMFSYGPFFHTGVKAEKTFGNFGVMLGLANPTDLKSASFSNKYVIGQVSAVSGNEKIKAYLNFQEGKPVNSVRVAQVDLVVTAAVTEKFSLGFNSTVTNVQFWERSEDFGPASQWWGAALYVNVDPKPWLGLTLRSELFNDKKQLNVFSSQVEGGDILANTLSFNFKVDDLIVIPELRFEKASTDIYLNEDGAPTNTAFSALLAAIYKF